jgi:hypothetical protein
MTVPIPITNIAEVKLTSKRPALMLILGGVSLEHATGTGTGNTTSSEVQPAARWTSSRDFDPGLTAAESPIGGRSPTAALSEVVKWLHRESGLTWEQIAKLFGVSRRTVHLWATGGSMNSRHFTLLNEVTQIIQGLPASTPKERRELLLLRNSRTRSLYDTVRDRLASDYIETNYDDINAAVREALTQLDGTAKSALSMITGLSPEEIDDLGGLL